MRRSSLAGSVHSIRSRSTTGATYFKPVYKIRNEAELAAFRKEVTTDDHIIPLEELIQRYNTNVETGLSQAQADELLKVNGPNCLIPVKKRSRWLVFLEFIFGGFNMVLWPCALLTLISYGFQTHLSDKTSRESLALAVVLIVVICFSGCFGFYHDTNIKSIMEKFNKMVPKYATVLRGGQKVVIPSEELVVGDVVDIIAGNIVPADVRLIETMELKVDNSSITGESLPITRTVVSTNANPLESSNLAFFSTSVIQGRGTGIVIQCGDQTVIGRIAGLTSGLVKQEALIRKEINHFAKVLSIFALFVSSVFFVVSLVLGYGFIRSLTFFIAVLVSNIPEGLPVILTTCMTLSAKRMAQKNCLVKNLAAIETLGSCNVICSDKTGTLTQNIMTVSHLFYDGRAFNVLDQLDDLDQTSEAFGALCLNGILCNNARFDQVPLDPEKKNKCFGDASECAILHMLEKLVGEVEFKRTLYQKVCEIPFNSSNKFQVSIHLYKEDTFLLVMKGAPERILEKCSTVLLDGVTFNLEPISKKPIEKAIDFLSGKGERVLAFADLMFERKAFPFYEFDADSPNFPLEGLRFIGMMSMLDPPRPSVPNAIARCKSAGIRVIMVTGDHPMTAVTVAKKIGLLSVTMDYDANTSMADLNRIVHDDTRKTSTVVSGNDLREMSDSDLEFTLQFYHEIVFARTSPQQKLQIVEALQRLNLIVAVTGDGVNDSPALKKADIGIAMGITGSDVAKEAADMILLDDNFASIVTGIEQGRLIFDNLKKSIFYSLTSNLPEIAPFILMVCINIPEPLSVISILVINVGTDMWPAISLIYEAPEADIMKRLPRNRNKDKLINFRLIFVSYCQIGVLQTCAGFVVYFLIMARHGFFWNDLIGLRSAWESSKEVEDRYGVKWSLGERIMLGQKCVAGYFLAIVIVQFADLVISKTRRLSVFQQGMTNHVLNAGIMFMLILAAIVVFCPFINEALGFESIALISIVPAIPYALIIFVYDEGRKLAIRIWPHGFIDKQTYY